MESFLGTAKCYSEKQIEGCTTGPVWECGNVGRKSGMCLWRGGI